jgi:tetratricopeptide (TPR) repeat protein
MNGGRNRIAVLVVGVMLASLLPASGESIEDLMSQGNMLLQNGAYDQAVPCYRKIVQRDPTNFEAQFNMALAYLNWGRSSNAVTEFQNALKINGQCSECWSNIAVGYQNLGESQKALDALSYSVKTNPTNIPARMNLATMYAKYDRIDDAIGMYKQVIQIQGNNLDAHINIAKCLISKGAADEARHYLKSALALNSGEPEVHYELANLAWKKDRNIKEAIKEYNEAINLQPNSQVYYENLALLYEELKENEDAIKTWKTFCIYLDDALRKEEINDRIAILEKGDNPSVTVDREGEIQKMKGGLQQSGRNGDAQIISTGSMDVMDDLKSLDDNDKGADRFDMEKAMKKKKSQKGKE